jgi:hypothetical protein
MKNPQKRSWRNLLLDTEYQLAFTTLLIVCCALFTAGLGWLVHKEAVTATQTAIQDVQGQALIDGDLAAAAIAQLEARRVLLDRLLLALGVGLSLGLFAYGLKMTHRVAGPLHKVAAYCDNVTAGRFDALRDLRRGDELVEFYEHFKQAHAAVRQRQERDVETLRAAIAAATDAELAGRSPELAARLLDLKALLATKEESLG